MGPIHRLYIAIAVPFIVASGLAAPRTCVRAFAVLSAANVLPSRDVLHRWDFSTTAAAATTTT